MDKKALLLSGGMDSIALAYWQRPEIAMTIDYGQLPAKTEIRSSIEVSNLLGIEHYIIKVDCSSLGSGDLINKKSTINSPSSEWWPFRNQLLLTLAAMRVISLGVTELMTASVKSDGFHRDGTEEFYNYASQMIQYQEGNIKITCPCINLSTAELIKVSKIPRNILLWAHSCHKSNIPCGNCRGCNKYMQVMSELNLL